MIPQHSNVNQLLYNVMHLFNAYNDMNLHKVGGLQLPPKPFGRPTFICWLDYSGITLTNNKTSIFCPRGMRARTFRNRQVGSRRVFHMS